MQFTTFALLAVAAATVSASAPQAYGHSTKSAQVYTFETRKAEPTKAAEYHDEVKEAKPTHEPEAYHGEVKEAKPTHEVEACDASSPIEKPTATKKPEQYGAEKTPEASFEEKKPEASAEDKKPEHYRKEKKAEPYREEKSPEYKDPYHSAPAKASPVKPASKVEVPEKEQPETTCAKGSEISCCNTDSSGSDFLGNILGGSCALQDVSLLSSLNSHCAGGNTFCCPTNQDGTLNINLSCIPIAL